MIIPLKVFNVRTINWTKPEIISPFSEVVIRRISKQYYTSESIIDFDGLTSEFGMFRGDLNIPWTTVHSQRYEEFAQKYSNGGFLAEILTGLQNAIQEICENIVLLDKVQYVSELGVNGQSCRIEKITKEELSPRCYALILDKKE